MDIKSNKANNSFNKIENEERINNNFNGKELLNRNLLLDNIFKNFTLKEFNNIIKKHFNKWVDTIKEENKLEINKDKDKNNLKEEIINKKPLENKDEINVYNNGTKTLFDDNLNDEEKEVIFNDMIYRFRILLILFYSKKNQNLSDSFEKV